MRYLIADHIFDIKNHYPDFTERAQEYLYTGERPTDCFLEATEQDLQEMAEKTLEEAGTTISPGMTEFASLNAKTAEFLLPRGYLLFHGSCIRHEGIGYIFTAVSGTGKSTHALLWHRVLGAEWINDDKPFLHIAENGAVTAYGSPWCGKHRRGGNTQAKIHNMIILKRGEKNTVKPISRTEAFPMLYQQSYRPRGYEAQVIQFLAKVQFNYYELCCNMMEEAPVVALAGIKKHSGQRT